MSLHIAPGLDLPTEAVTQTFAILAKRGVGKTYTASVMVEEMLKANLHVVVVDPIGVWWGLRSSADGEHAGLPIVIAGGEHADVPIEPTSGEVLAEMIVAQHLSMVIDISLFRKGEQHKFMTAFAETLYRKNRQAVHLVLDEADEFAPQRTLGEEARMLGAIEDLVRRGRARGIGVTMITQRPAVLNKNVLTQIEVLVALRLTSPQDRAAIAEWVKYHADNDEASKMLESLGSLPVGTAWFWSPGWLDLFKRVDVRQRETLDSSSTPKVGKLQVEARNMADVDIDKLRDALAATIEKVESDDPKVLKKRIDDLRRQLLAERPKPQVELRQIEVVPRRFMEWLDDCIQAAEEGLTTLTKARDYYKEYPVMDDNGVQFGQSFTKPPVNKPPLVDTAPKLAEMQISHGELRPLGAGEQKILTAAAEHRDGVTRRQITVLTGYKRSTRNTYLQRLQQWGLVTVTGERVVATDLGIETLGSDYTPLPTGEALRVWMLSELPAGEKNILEALIKAYPRALTRDEITEVTGYMRSTRNTYLQRMSAREVIEVNGQEVRASEELFEEVKR